MATSLNFEARTDQDFAGPSWNNSNEYPSLQSNEFAYDQAQLESFLARLEQTITPILPLLETKTLEIVPSLQAVCEMEEQAWILLHNMKVYLGCVLAVDGTNAEAQAATSRLTNLAGKLEALTKPIGVYLVNAPETLLKSYFSHPHVKPYEFLLGEKRKQADTLLSEKEEALLARLKGHGPLAFGTLYDQLSSQIRCHYEDPATKETRELGLAQTAALLRDGNEPKRRAAWRAIQIGWHSQETAAAAVVNGLAGWRLELTELRSAKRQAANPKAPALHFLDLPVHESRLQPETLNAMFGAVHRKIEMPRRAMRAMARALGKTTMDPWDLLAPAPVKGNERMSFERGFNLIRDAFYDVDPSLADFAETMKKNRWIEGRELPTKRPGAFCTRFPKSKSPRVFQTFLGSTNDVRTLAHELGHAYHGWVMRDLPLAHSTYPMTLAETASIFAETAFADSLSAKAKATGDRAAALEIAWQNAEAATALLNIPARFDFEKSFYERRQSGTVSVDELNLLMSNAWDKWYGDTLTEYETQYWMTKLHFSIAEKSFYNYPYTFGYLFSLGIYALRAEMRADFWPMYIALLRDTGCMTAEDLAFKYLKADLTKPDFWLKSLATVERQVAEFETLILQN